MNSKDIVSKAVGKCKCCDDPVYAPDDMIARAIIKRIPGEMELSARQRLHADIREVLNEFIVIVDNEPVQQAVPIN